VALCATIRRAVISKSAHRNSEENSVQPAFSSLSPALQRITPVKNFSRRFLIAVRRGRGLVILLQVFKHGVEAMTSPKRPRGRPRGKGKNDTPALMKVADILVREPALRPTTAMRHVISTRKDWGASDPTLLRRWQEKWKQQGEALLADTRERARPKLAPQPSFNQMAAIAATAQRAAMIDAATLRTVSAHMKAIKSVLESPVIKKWTDLNRFTDPTMKLWADKNHWRDAIAPALRFSEEHRRALEAMGGQQRMWQELAQHPHVWDSFSRIFPR